MRINIVAPRIEEAKVCRVGAVCRANWTIFRAPRGDGLEAAAGLGAIVL